MDEHDALEQELLARENRYRAAIKRSTLVP